MNFLNQNITLNQIQILLIIVLSFLLALVVILFFIRIFNRWKLAKIRKKGKQGEIQAKKYLEKLGYQILEQQASLTCLMKIDEKDRNFIVRADYLVEKDGKKGLVEVKSGQEVSKPWQLNTRRQLLEYYHYYPVDFILLFNSHLRTLQQIRFPEK